MLMRSRGIVIALLVSVTPVRSRYHLTAMGSAYPRE